MDTRQNPNSKCTEEEEPVVHVLFGESLGTCLGQLSVWKNYIDKYNLYGKVDNLWCGHWDLSTVNTFMIKCYQEGGCKETCGN